MNLTPEQIEAASKGIVTVMVGFGTLIAGITSTVTAFFTWKNRYELDKLYAQTVRAAPDGTPGAMRQHPEFMVKLFQRKPDIAARAVDPEPAVPLPTAEGSAQPPEESKP